jgi:Cft2 family RNA processing exonuclease
MSSIVLTNLTRNIEIGANCYALELAGRRILLDSGMHPRSEGGEATPMLELVPPDSVDAIFLTHAHQDHLGCLPLALRRHPRAPVFMTEATARLGDAMLHNSVNVMTRQGEEGQATTVLFSHREVEQGTKRWRVRPLHQRFDLSGERLLENEPTDVGWQLFDAGHILGSSGVLFEAAGRRILYTGDVNFEDQTLMRAAQFPEGPLDLLIMEATRGDHETPPDYTRAGEELRFATAIRETLERGGAAFIPLFALGKTQEVLAMLHNFRRRDLLRDVPVYIGGLSTKLTEIFDRLSHETPRRQPELKLLKNDALFTLGGPEAINTKIRPGSIYALSSGMMSENTLSNRLVRQILNNPRHSLFFVGYADPSSPAGALLGTPPGETISLGAGHEPQEIRCDVRTFSFSGHATRESLVAYAKRVQPKAVVLIHGDPAAISWMQRALQLELPDSRILSAPPGETMVF